MVSYSLVSDIKRGSASGIDCRFAPKPSKNLLYIRKKASIIDGSIDAPGDIMGSRMGKGRSFPGFLGLRKDDLAPAREPVRG